MARKSRVSGKRTCPLNGGWVSLSPLSKHYENSIDIKRHRQYHLTKQRRKVTHPKIKIKTVKAIFLLENSKNKLSPRRIRANNPALSLDFFQPACQPDCLSVFPFNALIFPSGHHRNTFLYIVSAFGISAFEDTTSVIVRSPCVTRSNQSFRPRKKQPHNHLLMTYFRPDIKDDFEEVFTL